MDALLVGARRQSVRAASLAERYTGKFRFGSVVEGRGLSRAELIRCDSIRGNVLPRRLELSGKARAQELWDETRGTKQQKRFVAATAGGDGGIKFRTIKLEQRALFGRFSGQVRGEGKHVGAQGVAERPSSGCRPRIQSGRRPAGKKNP
jgi:hypothetical protein